MFLQAFSSLAAVSTIVNAGGDTYNIPVHILIALVIGFIVAFLIVSGMKAKLKSVEKRENAQEICETGQPASVRQVGPFPVCEEGQTGKAAEQQ